jgi:Family of unknown function (DUF6158)
MSMGVSPRDLSDDDLRRELAHLKEKAEDIASDGTPDQQANHRTRTAELEAEFLRRFLPESAQSGAEPSAGGPAAPGSSGQEDAPDSSAAQEVAGSADVSPAGPDEGPLNQQPDPDAHDGETGQPSDAPTDDPDRPANPA